MTAASDQDTTLTYVVTGDATAGTDYAALTGTVTIAAGETEATIDIAVIDDAILEDNELVTVTLISVDDTDISINGSSDSASITIADDDQAIASIVATDSDAAEPSDSGQFTVSITQASDVDTIIDYVITGDATAGTDFVALSGSVTILAGQTTATIDVDVIDDAILDDNETVIVTLTNTDDPDVTIDTLANSATVTIADDESAIATIAATTPNAAEPAADGQFTVTLSTASQSDTVFSYTVGGDATAGDDYAALSGTVVILAGQTTTTIDVNVLDDSLIEATETVTVTLDSIVSGEAQISIGAADTDTVSIADDDSATVTLTATDASANEPTDGGQFLVSLSGISSTDTVIDYTIGGDAVAGSDYTPLSGTVTILAGTNSAVISVDVLDDLILESTETVTVSLDTITSGDADITLGTQLSDTVTILDDDFAQVTIASVDPSAGEPANAGQFQITMSAASDTDTVINYSIGGDATAGVDYTTLTGTATILAGQTSVLLDLDVLDDTLIEGDETVDVTLTSIASGDTDISLGIADFASITIADDDTAQISITANDASAAEPADSGQFTVTMDTASDTDTVISYTISGDATQGSDVASLSGTVTILAGQTSATIDVTTLDDAILEDDETVTVTLDSITSGESTISIGTNDTATVTIADDDTAEITIAANDGFASEPADGGQFTVSMSGISDTDTVVSYTIAGDATSGADFTPLSGTVTILAGTNSATIDVTTVDDSVLEATENVSVTLDTIVSGDADISIGTADTASVTIADDDTAELSIVANVDNASEPGTDGQFTISMSNPSDTDTVISYVVGGDATSGDDFVALTGTVTIAAGQTTATIDVLVLDDALLEDNENVTVTLASVDSGDADISIGSSNVATVVIADNDNAQVTISASDPGCWRTR